MRTENNTALSNIFFKRGNKKWRVIIFCDGVDKAPQRSLFNALGMTKEEMDRPLVGIVSSYNEIVPGHMNIDKIVEAVKMGVAMAGGTPVVFPAIAVCDGIAMGHMGMKYSLVTRDLIADSTECMALAHHFDALVMIPNCDKNVPGLLMAAARVNVPTISYQAVQCWLVTLKAKRLPFQYVRGCWYLQRRQVHS